MDDAVTSARLSGRHAPSRVNLGPAQSYRIEAVRRRKGHSTLPLVLGIAPIRQRLVSARVPPAERIAGTTVVTPAATSVALAEDASRACHLTARLVAHVYCAEAPNGNRLAAAAGFAAASSMPGTLYGLAGVRRAVTVCASLRRTPVRAAIPAVVLAVTRIPTLRFYARVCHREVWYLYLLALSSCTWFGQRSGPIDAAHWMSADGLVFAFKSLRPPAQGAVVEAPASMLLAVQGLDDAAAFSHEKPYFSPAAAFVRGTSGREVGTGVKVHVLHVVSLNGITGLVSWSSWL
ncbi:hypothetical protein ED733_005301 [Metarhizium rileyi]|uniref:Uncharacterized protein n=1 Tax=Metarhizium rileyi (strain RCEF 4871) TaxID=1649241 RepID=A0A5C6GAJ0_METRR|nr:hypothetical protein ED733_005301 [Metarhizium rileyi]